MIIFSNSKNIKIRAVIYLGSLFLGVIVGSIIYQILGDSEKLKLVIYSKYLSDNLYMEKVNQFQMLKYVFADKLKEMIILLLCGLTMYREVLYVLYILYLGMKCSVIVCVLTTIVKRKAILYFLSFNMPQIVVYVYIIYYVTYKMDFDRRMNGKTLFRILILVIGYAMLSVFLNPFFLKLL